MSISGAVVTGELLVDVEFIAFTVGVGATEIELLTNVVPGADGTDVDVEDDDVEAKVDTVVIDAEKPDSCTLPSVVNLIVSGPENQGQEKVTKALSERMKGGHWAG